MAKVTASIKVRSDTIHTTLEEGAISESLESNCEIIFMKITLICMKMELHVELIFMTGF